MTRDSELNRIGAAGWVAIITAIFLGLINLVAAWRQSVASEAQTEAIVKVAEVGDLTHRLVNSGSLIQLRLHAAAMRRIADLTKDPVDIKAAQDVATELKIMEGKQPKEKD